jgi:hypothetical protein
MHGVTDMNPKEIMMWAKFAFMALKFGRQFVLWAIDTYHEIEKRFKGKPGEEKAKEYDKEVRFKIAKLGKKSPKQKELDRIREKVWKSQNKKKRRSGKTRRR